MHARDINERFYGRMKRKFRILLGTAPAVDDDVYRDIFTICVALTNFDIGFRLLNSEDQVTKLDVEKVESLLASQKSDS